MTVQERQAYVRARRKKRGRRLMIAYALQGVIFLLLALMIVLMVCGVLYIREHLAPALTVNCLMGIWSQMVPLFQNCLLFR